jgi:ribonuclease P protein component
MLPRALRMRSAKDFQATTRSGRRFPQPLCVVFFRVESSANDRMVGVIASKAVGNSVARHRVTRRIREVVRQEASNFPMGSRIVIRALTGSAEAPDTVQQVRRALQQAMERVQ